MSKIVFRSLTNKGVVAGERPCGVSKTDQSGHEPITRLISRMTRGDISGVAGGGYYDAVEDVQQSFDGLPPQERDGFDMADAPAIIERGKAAIKAIEGLAKRRSEAVDKKANDNAPAGPEVKPKAA